MMFYFYIQITISQLTISHQLTISTTTISSHLSSHLASLIGFGTYIDIQIEQSSDAFMGEMRDDEMRW